MAFNLAFLSGALNLAGKGQPRLFFYDTADSLATVVAAGYFAECGAGADPSTSRGMEKGDIVIVRFYDSVTTKATFYGVEYLEVTAVDSDGDVTASSSGNAAVTATADGLTTGLIQPGVDVVAITSAAAANIVTLPVPAPGVRVVGSIGATGCEIRSLTGTTINAVAFPNELALAANSVFYATGLSATEWHIKTATKAGVWSATDIPDA
jgi:hypothetical protein